MIADLFVLTAYLPMREACAGVVLLDKTSGTAYLKMRPSWQGIADPEDAEVLEGYAETFRSEFTKGRAEPYLAMLTDTLSHVLRVNEPIPLEVTNFEAELQLQANLRGF